jgi:hypothetical protein
LDRRFVCSCFGLSNLFRERIPTRLRTLMYPDDSAPALVDGNQLLGGKALPVFVSEIAPVECAVKDFSVFANPADIVHRYALAKAQDVDTRDKPGHDESIY